MKKHEDMTLEETMRGVNTNHRFMHIWLIMIELLSFGLVLYLIFKHNTVVDKSVFSTLLILILIAPIISQLNSNTKAISKLYEKIMKEDKNN